MLACESSTTPCVLPYLMLAGSSPQSWMASYVCSPLPSTGGFVPALSSAYKIAGVTAAVCRKRRRDVSERILTPPFSSIRPSEGGVWIALMAHGTEDNSQARSRFILDWSRSCQQLTSVTLQ